MDDETCLNALARRLALKRRDFIMATASPDSFSEMAILRRVVAHNVPYLSAKQRVRSSAWNSTNVISAAGTNWLPKTAGAACR